MLTIMFSVMILVFVIRIIGFALKATWGIVSFLLSVFFFPIVLIGLFMSGLVYIALIVLAVALVGSFIGSLSS